jgi:hypothetical protein
VVPGSYYAAGYAAGSTRRLRSLGLLFHLIWSRPGVVTENDVGCCLEPGPPDMPGALRYSPLECVDAS